MVYFTVRVELPDIAENRGKYDELHKAMEASHFYRHAQIPLASGKKYDLPTAMYRCSHATWSAEDIADTALTIASKIAKNPMVFVTKGDEVAQRGLKLHASSPSRPATPPAPTPASAPTKKTLGQELVDKALKNRK